MPPTHGGKGIERGDSCGGGLKRRAADVASRKEVAGSGSGPTGETLQEKGAAASSGGAPTTHSRKGAVDTSSSGGELPEKVASASSGGSAALIALHRNTTAQDCEESDAKHRTKMARTASTADIPHEHCTEDEAAIGLSGGMLQKHSPKVEGDTAKGNKESDSNEIVHVKEEDTRVQEVRDLIKKMNASCIGEQISTDEFLGYFHRLPCGPPINLDDKLDDTAVDEQEFLHALYRFRYLKYQIQQQTSKGELLDDKLKILLDKSEDDCNQKFLEEEGFFRRFEEDWTLDWFIHPDYEECSALTDYQRLVLRNYNGTEYSRWSDYHGYLHSYKTEKEYLEYCEELSKKLKWMDDYVDDSYPTFEWGCITTRGAYQAIKIAATNFQEITATLAYNGYNEYEESMCYDAAWFKGYGEIYFEIWRRVTQNSISFKDALQEVCELKMFPLRQRVMEAALEDDYTLKWMESDYKTCTKAIASGDTEEKAQELIVEAVPTMVKKPKLYDQYIRKKIEIAGIIGILPREEDSEE